MKIRARERYILISADYSQQEPKMLAVLCQDEQMMKDASEGKDLYSAVAAKAFHTTYEECLEHFPEGTPITEKNKKWYYATEEEIKNKTYTKIANGETDTYKDGKERRKQAKVILLGMMYSRGPSALSEQLGCSIDEAKDIMNSVFDAFPNIKKCDTDSKNFTKKFGYTTTLWGRKRRLPDIKLEPYEFDFSNSIIQEQEQEKFKQQEIKKIKEDYWNKNKKEEIIENAKKKYGVKIKDNTGFIAKAERQVLNARIQGCLSGDTLIQSKKYGLIKLEDYKNQTLDIWDGNTWTPGTIVYSGKKQKCIIKFTDGSSIICSPNHKFLTINTYGKEVFKSCENLKANERIKINPNFIDSDYIYTSKEFKLNKKHSHNANVVYVEDMVNNSRFNAGRVLGRWASDGSYGVRKDCGSVVTHFVAEHEFEIIKELEHYMKNMNYKTVVEDKPRKDRNQKMARISIGSYSLNHELDTLDIKHGIHKNIFMDTMLLRGFISGFFDGDGSAQGTQIVLTFGTQYDFKPMILDMQKALKFFGIRSKFKQYNSSFRLKILRKDSKKFAQLIGFINTKKQRLAEDKETKRDYHCFGGYATAIIKEIEITNTYIDMYDVCNTNNGYFVADGLITHNSSADMTKKAMIAIDKNERLKSLDWKTIVPIHDEIIGTCPLVNAKECKELFIHEMSNAAKDRVPLDIAVDPVCSFAWYGEEIDLDKEVK